jgi:hypothetical protein
MDLWFGFGPGILVDRLNRYSVKTKGAGQSRRLFFEMTAGEGESHGGNGGHEE